MEMKSVSFEDKLEYGREVESLMQQVFMKIGWYVIPKYLYVQKGAPTLMGMEHKYAVPDLDIASNSRRFWVETKRKKIRNVYPDTGFSHRLFNHYLEVQRITGSDVFIIFFDEKINMCYGNWINNLSKDRTIEINDKITRKYPFIEPAIGGREEIIYFPYPSAFKNICVLENLNINSHGIDVLSKVFHTTVDKLNIRFSTKQAQILDYNKLFSGTAESPNMCGGQ